MMHDQSLLNQYFAHHWRPGNREGITSPGEISKLISHEEWQLDVGCGSNAFRQLRDRVVGIDPAFDQADVKCTIEDYVPDRLFDVATCLGSVNFGTVETIELQIDKVVACLKPTSRIYWRLNPGRHDHGNEECNSVPVFPWTFERLRQWATLHNYTQTREQIDAHVSRPRLYAEWHRSAVEISTHKRSSRDF